MLTEPEKDANRNPARQRLGTLAEIGYAIQSNAVSQNVATFNDAQVTELAILEHDIWLREKLLRGYVDGVYDSNAFETHTCCKTWKDLSDEKKDIDKQMVTSMLDELEKSGYVVVATERRASGK